MNKFKKSDFIFVISGKFKGKSGNIISVLKNRNLLIVEGINIVKKHVKPNPKINLEGGIVEKELPLHLSNVSLYNDVVKKVGRVKFIGYKNNKVRFFKINDLLVS